MRAAPAAARARRARRTRCARAAAGGFGRFTAQQAALCDRVGATHGIAIDPIFGGKTWSVLEARAAELARPERPLLYWHCGYTPEWALLGAAVRRGIA